MARKSRKNIKQNTLHKQTTFNVGAYVRLSVLNDKNKKDTIQNQKKIILDYINNKDNFKLIDFYEDLKTGTNFDRNGFHKLLSHIKQGKINCVIVKDLSRFGRNYIQCGTYIEKIFPMLNVRFISINEGFDSFDKNSNQFFLLHLKNVVNQMYTKDISKKTYSAIKQKQKQGDFIGSFAPYGYLKDKNNKNKIVINEEVKNIVVYIFDLKIKKYNYAQIANILNDKNILSPSAYLYKKGILYNQKFKNTKWTPQTVKRILTNEVYIGHTVQGKKCTKLFENKKQQIVPKQQWIVVKNTHTPIIDVDTFKKAQNN